MQVSRSTVHRGVGGIAMVEDEHSRIGRGEEMLKEAMVEVEVEVVLLWREQARKNTSNTLLRLSTISIFLLSSSLNSPLDPTRMPLFFFC